LLAVKKVAQMLVTEEITEEMMVAIAVMIEEVAVTGTEEAVEKEVEEVVEKEGIN